MTLRPSCLDAFFAPLRTLSGVGPKTAFLFDRLLRSKEPGGVRIRDLLFHLPHALLDRRPAPSISQAPREQTTTIIAEVLEHFPPARRGAKTPWRVLVADDTGDIQLVFFSPDPDWIRKILPIGEQRWISGKLQLWDGYLQMSHPDFVVTEETFKKTPHFEPIYGLTEGMRQKYIYRTMGAALERIPNLPEWHDSAILERHKWPSFSTALRQLHRPEGLALSDPAHPARLRLAYDELLAYQLALAMGRMHVSANTQGRATKATGALVKKLEQQLPFELTQAQKQAYDEIRSDLAAERQMLRLLQGDVGAGKTLVALMAMLDCMEAGRQSAMMVPTEILARQHAERLAPLVERLGGQLIILTGRDKASHRRDACEKLSNGQASIVIGTHALLEDDVVFQDLALAVIDEQHRFGVQQRLRLAQKGAAVDVLVMTATPIPRTLVMTSFGDMDVSILSEKPKGRQPIDTRAMPLEKTDDLVAGLGRAITTGARIYWICPLVEESELMDLAAAQERYEALQQIFGSRVGLVHGRLKGAEKEKVMEDFASGVIQILVATTVVEVGVDVPEATIMVIEHAERFGLAQLHQLRGRVGRGAAASHCILLYKAPLGAIAKARLEMMRTTEDGFRLAEEDLRLRGEGEILGTKQSGLPDFHLALHEGSVRPDLLRIAHEEARAILTKDPKLEGPRGEQLKLLLHLFEKASNMGLLRAG